MKLHSRAVASRKSSSETLKNLVEEARAANRGVSMIKRNTPFSALTMKSPRSSSNSTPKFECNVSKDENDKKTTKEDEKEKAPRESSTEKKLEGGKESLTIEKHVVEAKKSPQKKNGGKKPNHVRLDSMKLGANAGFRVLICAAQLVF